MTGTTPRALLLLSLLQVRRDWAGDALAERLEVSPRTVRRDVERLRDLGYRIRALKGPAGGYRLEAGSELPPLLFDDEQAVAVALALRTAAVTGVEIDDGAARALVAVRQVMPARLRHRIDALEVTALAGATRGPLPAVDPEVLITLAAAARAGEVLRFDYAERAVTSATAEPGPRATPRPPRRVEPHHVVTNDGRWYLVAWDLDVADWRIYRADRISPRTPTGPRFAPREIPGGDVREFVAARFKGSSGTNTWPCWGEAVLDLPESAVVPFIEDGTVEARGPDRSRVRVGSWSWGAMAAALGRFEAAIEVVGPPELAEAFAVQAARFRAAASS